MSKSILPEEYRDLRAEYIRIVGKRIGELDLKPRKYRAMTGCNISSQRLYDLKEGASPWSLERLIAFGRRIGIDAVLVPIEGPLPSRSATYRPSVTDGLSATAS